MSNHGVRCSVSGANKNPLTGLTALRRPRWLGQMVNADPSSYFACSSCRRRASLRKESWPAGFNLALRNREVSFDFGLGWWFPHSCLRTKRWWKLLVWNTENCGSRSTSTVQVRFVTCVEISLSEKPQKQQIVTNPITKKRKITANFCLCIILSFWFYPLSVKFYFDFCVGNMIFFKFTYCKYVASVSPVLIKKNFNASMQSIPANHEQIKTWLISESHGAQIYHNQHVRICKRKMCG